MAHAEHSSADTMPQEHKHDVLPVWIYWAVYLALMVFLGLTYGASLIDLGPFNIVVALIIAIIKTVLVVLFFMHVKYSSKLTWLWAGLGFVWLLLMFGTMGDYVTREWIRVPGW
jgi:cytochrome c oxidase subunit 4